MPTFPSYAGPPLPEVLNPVNPRHCWMLADWIFFKPSRLRQYLYRADPDLYRRSGWPAMIAALRRPAYRSLLMAALVLIVVLSAALSAPVACAASAIQATQVRWGLWAVGVAVGVALGVAVGVAYGVALGVAVGVAGGVALGVAFGVALGVAGGVAVGVAGRVAGGVAGGVAFGVALGVAFGMAGGVAFGVAFGVALGVAGGVAFGVAGGVAGGVAFGVALDVAFGVAGGVAGGVATCAGAARGVFYSFQLSFQLWSALWQALCPDPPSHRLARHPALGDELAVLPFPGLGRLLAAALAENFALGLCAARCLLRNPFQRWAVARGFARFLAVTPDPLAVAYRALSDPLLDEYPNEPDRELDFRHLPQVRALWLGELGGHFVHAASGRDFGSERMAWTVTRPLRGRPHPQVAALARFLLHLLDGQEILEQGVDQALLDEAAAAVQDLPHGDEVAPSLTALARLAGVGDLEDVAAAREALGWLDEPVEAPLRPRVLEASRGLGDTSTEAARFCQSTSPAAQAAALNRAVGMLNELARYVERMDLPERNLLRLVLDRWQALVADASGRLGERALREMAPSARRALAGGERRAALWSRPAEPFPNPYKAGDPVSPPLFVGRGDVFNRIHAIWASKVNPDSVILYGHRRMGKSSILRNLGAYAPPGHLLVYSDLKGESAIVRGTHDLLRGLADAVAWSAQRQDLHIPEPDPADYAEPAEAALSFHRLLRRILAALPGEASLILALDEFEVVDDAVKSERIGEEIYDYLRSISHEPRIVLVFAGLHTLDEMSRNYQEAFFESYVNVRVSYLPPKAAERLITRPTPDFPLNYHPEVVARVVRETNGQPLLIQRICQELVNQVNHELFDRELDREVRVLPEDLEAVLSDEFVQSETRYFDGIWAHHVAGRAVEAAVLGALAQAGPATAGELAQETNRSETAIAGALAYLDTRDLIAPDAAGRWDLRVPLMRRWMRLRR